MRLMSFKFEENYVNYPFFLLRNLLKLMALLSLALINVYVRDFSNPEEPGCNVHLRTTFCLRVSRDNAHFSNCI